MPDTERDLIRACRSGDAAAWEDLLNRYERLVFSIPLNYGLAAEDAADIAQITFTILLQSLDHLPDDLRLPGWLATVARRHTWRLMSRRRREAVNPQGDIAQDERFGGVADERERLELLEWLNHGLSLLDQRCSQLLMALYFDSQQPSYAQVAERLHMPVGSIGPTRARCLEQMKKHLERATQPEPAAGP
jgi:RNA polymerase sigma factor (sigma-70 family)